MTDPLHDAMREATLAVLLGSTNVPLQTIDPSTGLVTFQGTMSIPSAFGERIRARVAKGEYDNMIDQAMASITADMLVPVILDKIGERVLAGLDPKPGRGYGSDPTPGWLQRQARDIATEAVTAALKDDEGLMDTLRSRIGAEVDRNRVGINVSLSAPEQ